MPLEKTITIFKAISPTVNTDAMLFTIATEPVNGLVVHANEKITLLTTLAQLRKNNFKIKLFINFDKTAQQFYIHLPVIVVNKLCRQLNVAFSFTEIKEEISAHIDDELLVLDSSEQFTSAKENTNQVPKKEDMKNYKMQKLNALNKALAKTSNTQTLYAIFLAIKEDSNGILRYHLENVLHEYGDTDSYRAALQAIIDQARILVLKSNFPTFSNYNMLKEIIEEAERCLVVARKDRKERKPYLAIYKDAAKVRLQLELTQPALTLSDLLEYFHQINDPTCLLRYECENIVQKYGHTDSYKAALLAITRKITSGYKTNNLAEISLLRELLDTFIKRRPLLVLNKEWDNLIALLRGAIEFNQTLSTTNNQQPQTIEISNTVPNTVDQNSSQQENSITKQVITKLSTMDWLSSIQGATPSLFRTKLLITDTSKLNTNQLTFIIALHHVMHLRIASKHSADTIPLHTDPTSKASCVAVSNSDIQIAIRKKDASSFYLDRHSSVLEIDIILPEIERQSAEKITEAICEKLKSTIFGIGIGDGFSYNADSGCKFISWLDDKEAFLKDMQDLASQSGSKLEYDQETFAPSPTTTYTR